MREAESPAEEFQYAPQREMEDPQEVEDAGVNTKYGDLGQILKEKNDFPPFSKLFGQFVQLLFGLCEKKVPSQK